MQQYVARCTQCCTRKSFPAPVAGKPIISKGFLQRVQIDLVSFEKRPDGEYRHIAHLRDHFTRFSWTCPLRSKEASEVAAFIFQFLLCLDLLLYYKVITAGNSLQK